MVYLQPGTNAQPLLFFGTLLSQDLFLYSKVCIKDPFFLHSNIQSMSMDYFQL